MKSPSSKLKRPARVIRKKPTQARRPYRWPVPEMAELTADAICWEVSLFLRVPLPRDRYVRWLAAKAELCFQGNEAFRRKMMDNRCREWLRVFIRHWLYSLLRCERPDLHADLPESFALGHPLPQDRPRPKVYRRTNAKQSWHPERVLAHPRWRFLVAA